MAAGSWPTIMRELVSMSIVCGLLLAAASPARADEVFYSWWGFTWNATQDDAKQFVLAMAELTYGVSNSCGLIADKPLPPNLLAAVKFGCRAAPAAMGDQAARARQISDRGNCWKLFWSYSTLWWDQEVPAGSTSWCPANVPPTSSGPIPFGTRGSQGLATTVYNNALHVVGLGPNGNTIHNFWDVPCGVTRIWAASSPLPCHWMSIMERFTLWVQPPAAPSTTNGGTVAGVTGGRSPGRAMTQLTSTTRALFTYSRASRPVTSDTPGGTVAIPPGALKIWAELSQADHR